MLATAGVWLAAARAVHAHDPGLSSMTLTQHDARGAFELVVENSALPAARRAQSRACDASGVVALQLDDRALAIAAECSAHDAEHTAYAGTFALPHAGRLTVAVPLLAELPRGHRSFARVQGRDGRVIAERMLDRAADRLSLSVTVPARGHRQWAVFASLGAAAIGLLLWLGRRSDAGARPKRAG
jgi:hypothetical protein